jgi:hypothetical protein
MAVVVVGHQRLAHLPQLLVAQAHPASSSLKSFID